VIPALIRGLSAQRGLLPLTVLGAVALTITLILFAPGYMSRDSGMQLEQARSLLLNDAHPALMAVIWRFTDRIVPGPFGMLALTSTLYWAGLTGLMWSLRGPLAVRAAGLLAVGFFPPAFSNVPVIWKDTLMQAALLAGLACVVLPTQRARLARHLLALVFFAVAMAARHNAAAAVWPLLAFALLQWPVLTGAARWLRLTLASAAAMLLTVAIVLGIKAALAPFVKSENLWQHTAAFDLAGISLRRGELLIQPDNGVLSPGMGLAEIRKLYRPDYGSKLYHCVPFAGSACMEVFNRVKDPEQLANLSRTWRRAIFAHPADYLAHRWAVAAPLLGWSGGPVETYFLATAPHHKLARPYPLPPRATRALQWIEDRLRWSGFRPAPYVLLAILLLPVLLVRHLRGGPGLPVAFLLSGLSCLLSLLIAAGSPDYRYMVWTILCTVLAAVTSLLPAQIDAPGRLPA
jgi:hypothetical protein